MNASATIPLIACALFAAGMLHAAVTDLRERRIRNWLVAALAGVWVPMALAAGLPGGGMAAAALAAGLIFAAGFGCFAAGWVGGGDVKLATVAVLWLGAGQAVPFLLLTAVLGAGLALPLLVTGRLRPSRTSAAAACAMRGVPYGPALALAGMLLLPGSPWAGAF